MWLNRLFRSNQMSDVSALLISLTKNEQPWAICSGHAEEMSDVSKSLISLTKNERMSESLIFLSESIIRSFLDKKRAIRSEIKWANSQPCLWATWVNCSRSLIFSERPEQFSHIAQRNEQIFCFLKIPNVPKIRFF